MSLESDFFELVKTKERIAELGKRLVELELSVIADLDKLKLTQIDLEDGAVKGTIVRVTRVVIDDVALEAALTSTMWNKITKRSLDKTMLEAQIVVGKIDAAVVAGASEEKANKPFLKITGSTLGIVAVLPSILGVKARKKTTP